MNWYKASQTSLSPQEIKDIVNRIISEVWRTEYIDKDSKYDFNQVKLIAQNEEHLNDLIYRRGEDNAENILSALQEELIRREEVIFKQKATKLGKDPLAHIKMAIKGKSWEIAKRTLAEMHPSGVFHSKDVKISDEDAEDYFQRLYRSIFQSGFANPKMLIERSPYQKNKKRYIKRLNQIKNTGLNETDVYQYDENTFLNQNFGYQSKKVPDIIEVYRGVPRPDVKLRPGDHVTTDRTYASGYVRGKWGSIVRDQVKAEDLIIMKLDINYPEFIYYPQNIFEEEMQKEKREEIKAPITFKDFYNQVNLKSSSFNLKRIYANDILDISKLVDYITINFMGLYIAAQKIDNKTYLGTLDIKNFLDDIYAKNSVPPKIPTSFIDLFAIKRGSRNKALKAAFVNVLNNPSLKHHQLIIFVDDFSEKIDKDDVERHIEHEIEHFIKDIYSKTPLTYKTIDFIPDNPLEYFSDEEEIDSHSRDMAKFFINNLKLFNTDKIERGESINDVIKRLIEKKTEKINTGTQATLYFFFKENEKSFNIKFPQIIKDEYHRYLSRYIDFFYNKMIEELKNI